MKKTEWLIHNIVTIIFSITAILIVPFVQIYTSGVNDAEYYQPIFGISLVISYAFLCLRVPYFRLIKAAGMYKETQNGSIIQMILNVVLSVILVLKFELIGVAIGTLLAMAYHTIYLALFLRNNIIKRPFKHFIKSILIDFVIVMCIVPFAFVFKINQYDYLNWIIYAFKISLISILCGIFVNLLFNFKKIKLLVSNIIKRRKR